MSVIKYPPFHLLKEYISLNTDMQKKRIRNKETLDRQQFDKLFRRYYNALFFFAARYVHDKDDAENLVQEAFMAFWLNRENINERSENSLKAWLYNTLKNKCLNFLEKESSQKKYNEYIRARNSLNILALSGYDINEAVFDEVFELLDKVLEEMPEQSRAVFEMSRMNGMKNKEIAEVLGISVKAVEANMTRALKFLKTRFREYIPLLFFLVQ